MEDGLREQMDSATPGETIEQRANGRRQHELQVGTRREVIETSPTVYPLSFERESGGMVVICIVFAVAAALCNERPRSLFPSSLPLSSSRFFYRKRI